MIRPLLTIAIPTYNRAKTLKKSILNTLKYFDKNSMELLISDNASTDETREVVSQLQATYNFIKYFRKNTNTGFDGNFLNCFNKANGKYLLILSDDDFLLPGSIESILTALEKEPTFMHLNSSSLLNSDRIMSSTPRFPDSELKIYTDKNRFIQDVGIYVTFLSSLVFNVDLVRNITNKQQYMGSSILQAHVAFETMRNDGNYIINTFNCIAATGNNVISYDLYEVWVFQLKKLFLETAVKCGFEYNKMENLYCCELKTTVYDFVLKFRYTCSNSNSWNQDFLWKSISEYKSIEKKYRIAVSCPKLFLPFLIKHNFLAKKYNKKSK
ncbi:glycosyltransferase family 2 protein [Eubacterium limosum]|uniref:glycosyltransferase family 2 protein n=1 Tax=Eubacterium limosum TaxID=1736 RepID=UPI00106273E1|nr:glycosyltransferase family 2 protein [Eubacterium limosum]